MTTLGGGRGALWEGNIRLRNMGTAFHGVAGGVQLTTMCDTMGDVWDQGPRDLGRRCPTTRPAALYFVPGMRHTSHTRSGDCCCLFLLCTLNPAGGVVVATRPKRRPPGAFGGRPCFFPPYPVDTRRTPSPGILTLEATPHGSQISASRYLAAPPGVPSHQPKVAVGHLPSRASRHPPLACVATVTTSQLRSFAALPVSAFASRGPDTTVRGPRGIVVPSRLPPRFSPRGNFPPAPP